MKNKKYLPVEYTADIGLKIFGRNKTELFVHAFEGLLDIAV